MIRRVRGARRGARRASPPRRGSRRRGRACGACARAPRRRCRARARCGALAARRARPRAEARRRGVGGARVVVVVLARDRVLELAHALAERAAHLGQPLRRRRRAAGRAAGSRARGRRFRTAWPHRSTAGRASQDEPLDRVPVATPIAARRGYRPRPASACRITTAERTHKRGTARDQEPARRAGGRHRDRQGRRPRGRPEREARDHGPERLGQVDARLRADGPSRPTRSPRARSCSTARTSPSSAPTSARSAASSSPSSTRTRSPASPSRASCAARSTRSARRANGGEDDPIPVKEFRTELLAAMERAEGAARARVALPQRRLLGRREEARRDPADGDAEAADRGARRDRLRPRHRRAADRRERRQRRSSARRWARS